jgi:hypothetical protein
MLHKPEPLGAGDTVRRLLAVQAQDLRGARLALRARTKGLTARDVDAALNSAELVVSWLCRGTLHMVHRDDFAWVHALTAPPVVTMNRHRLEQEGVTNPERAVKIVVKALGDGPLLRSELAEGVEAAGIQAKGQAMIHILLKATLEGHVVRGPIRGREQAFALTRDWLGNDAGPVDRERALAELARRYLAAHAPADAADLARWAGITLGNARAGLRVLGAQKPPPAPRRIPPRLLGQFDPYVLGWKDRSFAVPPEHEKTLLPGGGMFRAVAIDDGLVIGDWERVAGDERFARERADIERFLDSRAARSRRSAVRR